MMLIKVRTCYRAPADEGDAGGGAGEGNEGDNNQQQEGSADGLADFAKKGDDGEGDQGKQGAEGKDGEGRSREGTGEGEGEGKSQSVTLDAKPEWLPENFWDAKTGEVKLESLAKSQRDLRAQLSKGDKAPEKPDGYEIELDEKVQAIEDTIAAEVPEVRDGIREIMHAAGVGQEKAAEIYPKVIELLDTALGEKLVPETEFKALGKYAQETVDVLYNFGNVLVERGTLTKDEQAIYNSMWRTADEARVMQKIRENYGERGVPTESSNIKASSDSAADLAKELSAARKDVDKGVPGAERKMQRVLEKYEKVYGTAPA